ncbi:MAG: hypothetical protein AMJ89_00625 [candidate division Zixibacteria bacterium SM23_73]|nr:MAG: hypothetical protein AMJ89_00625 [candidate division Zixibacteria bacterium SM23_73]
MLDKMGDYGYYVTVLSEQLHASIGDIAGFSLPRVQLHLGCELFLEEAHGVRMNYPYTGTDLSSLRMVAGNIVIRVWDIKRRLNSNSRKKQLDAIPVFSGEDQFV